MKRSSKRVDAFNLLTCLHDSPPTTRHLFIKHMQDSDLHTLGELTKNTLFNRRCTLTPKDQLKIKNKLGKRRKAFEKIAQKSTPNKVRRRLLLEQNGQGLIATLLSVCYRTSRIHFFPTKNLSLFLGGFTFIDELFMA